MTDNELLLAISDIVDKKIQPLATDIKGVRADIEDVKSDVEVIKNHLTETNRRITAIEMTIENELSHNIKIIAEGHLDLSRKLNEAVYLASEIKAKQEIQDLYIKSHDSRLKIKDLV